MNPYEIMWLFVMFDLPVETPAQRKRYAKFRNMLLAEGFSMIQYSIYARPYASEEANQAVRDRIQRDVPPQGHVRLMSVTDRQFAKTQIIRNHTPEKPADAPRQYLLF